MRYYVEVENEGMREALEAEVLAWPQVTHKKMMGCPCYLAGGKIFAGLVTRGMVITKLTPGRKTNSPWSTPWNPSLWAPEPSRNGHA